MGKTTEALRMALEALEYHTAQTRPIHQTNEAITAIKEALAQPEQDIAALVTGMEVSIDVSTGEHDSGHRLFGVVDLVQQSQGSKHDLILLVQEPKANFKEVLAEQEQEPKAWRTFDGEGGYDYRSYDDNESYADDWNKRNPNHKGWVDKLYTHSQRTWVGLAAEDRLCAKYMQDAPDGIEAVIDYIEAKLKEKNT